MSNADRLTKCTAASLYLPDFLLRVWIYTFYVNGMH